MKQILLLLLALLLSGCGLLWAGGDPPVTATPVPTPTPEPTPLPLQVLSPDNITRLQVDDSLIVSYPFRLVWSLDGNTLGVMGREGAFLYDTSDWTRRGVMLTQQQEIFLDISPDGQTLALTLDQRSVELRNILSGQKLKMLLPPWFFSSAFFAPDGLTLAMPLVENPAVDIWNVPLGEIAQTARGFAPGSQPWKASYPGPAGHLAWSSGAAVQIIDLKTDLTSPVMRQEDEISVLALSPSASILASAGAAQVTLWEANSGKRLLRLPVPAAPAAMLFSPDGSLLVAGVGGQLLLWESVTWTQLAAIDLPNGTVLSMAFSPDGRQIACGVSDGSVLLWGVR